jgi:tRNA (guanosine-2'-O-)-methyltransferase
MTVSDRRLERMAAILDRRLESVVVVLETVYRRHNVSAIMRSAEGFGVHEVHLITNGFRPSKGAARGAERWIEVRVHADTAGCVAALKDRGYAIWAADLHPDAVSPDAMPVDQPVAVLMGAELTGVSAQARALVDGFVTVPMVGMTESLNVSVAAACILSRLTDRRRALVGAGDLSAERKARILAAWIERDEAAARGRAARAGLQAEVLVGNARDKR